MGSTLTLDLKALTTCPRPRPHHTHWSGKPAYRGTRPHGHQGLPQADKPGPGWGRRHAGSRRTPPASAHTLGSSHSHPAPGVPPVGTGVVSRDRYRVSGTAGHTPEETETSLSFDYHGKYGDSHNWSLLCQVRQCGILSLALGTGRTGLQPPKRWHGADLGQTQVRVSVPDSALLAERPGSSSNSLSLSSRVCKTETGNDAINP